MLFAVAVQFVISNSFHVHIQAKAALHSRQGRQIGPNIMEVRTFFSKRVFKHERSQVVVGYLKFISYLIRIARNMRGVSTNVMNVHWGRGPTLKFFTKGTPSLLLNAAVYKWLTCRSDYFSELKNSVSLFIFQIYAVTSKLRKLNTQLTDTSSKFRLTE